MQHDPACGVRYADAVDEAVGTIHVLKEGSGARAQFLQGLGRSTVCPCLEIRNKLRSLHGGTQDTPQKGGGRAQFTQLQIRHGGEVGRQLRTQRIA